MVELPKRYQHHCHYCRVLLQRKKEWTRSSKPTAVRQEPANRQLSRCYVWWQVLTRCGLLGGGAWSVSNNNKKWNVTAPAGWTRFKRNLSQLDFWTRQNFLIYAVFSHDYDCSTFQKSRSKVEAFDFLDLKMVRGKTRLLQNSTNKSMWVAPFSSSLRTAAKPCKKDIHFSDHNPLLYVFFYIYSVSYCISGATHCTLRLFLFTGATHYIIIKAVDFRTESWIWKAGKPETETVLGLGVRSSKQGINNSCQRIWPNNCNIYRLPININTKHDQHVLFSRNKLPLKKDFDPIFCRKIE
jgi:hypothetical protein